MLNDLLSIERSIAAHGIDPAERHPDVKDMAKGPAFRVRLSSTGAIAGVDLVPDAGRGILWTLRDGQHNGFPGLKTAAGLLSLDAPTREAHQQAWESDKTPAVRRDELLRLAVTASLDAGQTSAWPNAGHRKRIAERLESLRSLADDSLTAAVPAAFERFLLAIKASPPFLEALLAALTAAVRDRGDEWLEPVRTALLGPAALFIDVPDLEFNRDAGDPRQIGPVSAALSVRPQGGATAEDAVSCALSGKTGNLHSGNFPQPNLPGLGQTYLFARNKDIPSLTRYGRTADASFPIDSELVRRLSGAITVLTRDDAKGRCWRLIPAETGDKPDLLVTTLVEARLADALAGDDDDDSVDGQSAWDELGARLIRQTHGIDAGEAPRGHVAILVLRTVDPANRKAIYHRNTTSAEIWQAAQRWQDATANVADWLGFVLPVKGERAPVFWRPPFVKPLSITPLSRVQFANGGRRRVPVIGVTAADAFGLFLQEGDVEKRARKVLRLVLQRHGALLSGLAAARIKGIDHLKDFDPKTDLRRNALRSVSWIGALLHQLGRLKEVYMSDAGFRLGQLLAAADVVHVGYCMDIRDGSIPSSLLGNALLGIAADRPHGALKLLLRRWPPYAAWAKNEPKVRAEAAKADKNKSIALGKALSQARRIGPIAAALSEQLRGLDGKMDDVFQAELLLGYMAGLPKAVKSGNGDSGSESDEANEGEEA